MKILDLFAGIGGFSLAAQRVWPGIEHEFVEIDPFCQNVLRKHWPKAKIHGDIKTYKGTEGDADLITGGFPCQPFSAAGRRKGTEDSRHLWPEMLRVISEVRPRWVIGENVAGFTTWNDGMVFDEVQSDLENEGSPSGRLWFQLRPSMRRTEGIESGLLLKTPSSSDAHTENMKSKGVSGSSGTLAQEMKSGYAMENRGMLPTPQAIDASGKGRKGRLKKDSNRDPNKPGSYRADLKDHIALLPTPTAGRADQEMSPSQHKRKSKNLAQTLQMLPTPNARDWKGASGNQEDVPKIVGTKTGLKLQPAFALWMMGFPTDWCDFPTEPKSAAAGGEGKRSRQQGTQSSRKSRRKS